MSTKFTNVAFAVYAGSPARYSPLPAFRGIFRHSSTHDLTDDPDDIRSAFNYLLPVLYRSGCSRVFLCFSGHRFIVELYKGEFCYVKCR